MSNSELIDQFRNFIDEKCKEKLNLIKYLHVLMIPSHWDYTFYVIWTVDLNRLFLAGTYVVIIFNYETSLALVSVYGAISCYYLFLRILSFVL